MKYRVAIYDLDYEIEAKSTEGAIRAAIARYAKTETAQTSRHCSPDRLTRGPTVAEGREWEAVLEKSGSRSARHQGRWVPCNYVQRQVWLRNTGGSSPPFSGTLVCHVKAIAFARVLERSGPTACSRTAA